MGYVITSFFIKFIGYASSVGIQNYFSAKEFYYYRNAGYSIKRMYSYAFLIDLIIYAFMVYTYTVIISKIYA